jgi:hypothetical protein
MRYSALGLAYLVAIGVAITEPGLAASKKRVVHHRSHSACVALAQQRGFSSQDLLRDDSHERYQRFIAQCMQGKQH